MEINTTSIFILCTERKDSWTVLFLMRLNKVQLQVSHLMIYSSSIVSCCFQGGEWSQHGLKVLKLLWKKKQTHLHFWVNLAKFIWSKDQTSCSTWWWDWFVNYHWSLKSHAFLTWKVSPQLIMLHLYPPFQVQCEDLRRFIQTSEDCCFSPQPTLWTQHLLPPGQDSLLEEQWQAVLHNTETELRQQKGRATTTG